jgi:enamine deaminase RidA (YjgF/YER057c/UK114 family)
LSKRISIEIPGFAHDNPIPAACRKGPFLITSGVSGKEPFTGKYAEGIDAQCAQMFDSIRKILDAAGATIDDIVKINIWLKDRDLRPHVNKEWLAMFPDPHSRPARHTFQSPDLPGGMLVQCEVIAFVESEK